MPQTQMGQIRANFVDKRRTPTEVNSKLAGNYQDLDTMKAALTDEDTGTHTAEQVDRMTMNDVVYAYRLLVDKDGF